MIRAWDANGACVLAFDGSCNSKTSLVVCSDGCLLSSNFGGYVHGWDSTTGESLFSIEVEAHKIIAFAVLPDGGLVTASSEYEIQVWE
jgi:WD40 repeat protein